MTAVDLIPTDQLAPATLHAAFGRAFADYLAGPFTLEPQQWPGFLLRQGIDLSLGRAAVQANTGTVLAFALVAPRPSLGRWRLGTMGAVPEARGSGAAVHLLQDFVARGREAGLAAVELEVFAQNERALRLYRRHGFVEQHALHGWQRAADAAPLDAGAGTRVEGSFDNARDNGCNAPRDGGCDGVDQADALAWLRQAEAVMPDLPLQVGASVVGALPVPWRAWRRDRAQLVFTVDPTAGVIVRSLIDLDPAQAGAQALLRQLVQRHAGLRVSVPPLQRPDLGGHAAQRCGFARDALHQFFMRRDLAGPLVRDESPADADAIAAVQAAAFREHPFSRHDEAQIVERLREQGALTLSLVALEPSTGEVLGHAAFSPVQMEGEGALPGWQGLGPVAVRPGRQRQGVGSALVRAGLARLNAAGSPGCVVLGDPGWYARFGFQALDGLTLPGVPPDHFLALRLDESCPWPRGRVTYDAAFGG